MKQPSVYILVLNWNNFSDTANCIRSLHRLTYKNKKILLIDNGSEDDSLMLLKKEFPEISSVDSEKNLGFGAGNNLGIRLALKAQADFIWLVNNDAVVDEKALCHLVSTAGCERIGVVGSVLYNYDKEDKSIQTWGGGRINKITGLTHNLTKSVELDKLDYITGASMLLSCKAVKEVGAFDERFFMYWEDVDLSQRIRKQGWEFAVAEESLVWHKENASLGKENPDLYRMNARSACLFILKHSNLPILRICIYLAKRVFGQVVRGNFHFAKPILDGGFVAIREHSFVLSSSSSS